MALKRGRKIGPYTRTSLPRDLDGRTRAAAFVKGLCAELTKFVGDSPTLIQRQLIDRAAMLALRIEFMEQKVRHNEPMGLHDTNHYLAWSNTYRRYLLAIIGTADNYRSEMTTDEALRLIYDAADDAAGTGEDDQDAAA
jgi:hypothetical protein